MKCFIGLGSNLGDRKLNLERATQLLSENQSVKRCSPLVETNALTPKGAPGGWSRSFLNGVVEIDSTVTAHDLLILLKKIEREIGREEAPRWAPRLIDLDLLTYGPESFRSRELTIPHPEMERRSFVLDPLKHLQPDLKLFDSNETLLNHSRTLEHPLPLWMGILNLTPDSFSDGGEISQVESFHRKIDEWDDDHVQILDLGAESTRPGATAVSPENEWARLRPALEWLKERYGSRFFRPLISVDTRHSCTARRALEMNADIINDVSGLSDTGMLELLQNSNCQYVLMHSLSVPADSKVVLNDEDPVETLKAWAAQKLEVLLKAGISMNRIFFDPGIGFGKTADQSMTLLKRIHEFFDLPVRIVVGHSRKSFLKAPAFAGSMLSAEKHILERDGKTLGISLALAERGVDVLRVHTPHWHAQAHLKFLETQE